MIITEFLEGRTVERQAVTRYIERHPELFSGHTSKKGKDIVLDSNAVEILAKQYPLAKPVQVIQGVDPEEYKELQQRYASTLEKVNDLLSWKAETAAMIADTESKVRLLQLQNKIDTEEAVKKAIKEEEDKLHLAEQRAERLQAELDAERSKTWLQKLLGK